jgi:S-adenosylmethionine synthetase
MTIPIISALKDTEQEIEIVERKGLGHPDTICDALAESFSRNLCREYRRRFGQILHHNVDKALLCGGRASPAFSGGTVLAPMNLYLAGRAVAEVGNDHIPIREIAVEGSRSWIRANLHAIDAERHINIHELVQPGSHDLQALFSRSASHNAPLANDTSIGVGYAPMSRLELLVLETEQQINRKNRSGPHASWGEDVKVMGIRSGSTVQVTVACAMIGRYLAHIDDYFAEKVAIETMVRELAAKHGFSSCRVGVNIGDDPGSGAIYLTVTGTSAEAGDDGQVGRGNRVNGLITPCRPMSLEAAAGKNPVSHVGKIYNVLAQRICATVVETLPYIAAAQCLLVSQIGAPVTSPALLEVKVALRDGLPVSHVRNAVADIAAHELAKTPELIDAFIEGTIATF